MRSWRLWRWIRLYIIRLILSSGFECRQRHRTLLVKNFRFKIFIWSWGPEDDFKFTREIFLHLKPVFISHTIFKFISTNQNHIWVWSFEVFLLKIAWLSFLRSNLIYWLKSMQGLFFLTPILVGMLRRRSRTGSPYISKILIASHLLRLWRAYISWHLALKWRLLHLISLVTVSFWPLIVKMRQATHDKLLITTRRRWRNLRVTRTAILLMICSQRFKPFTLASPIVFFSLFIIVHVLTTFWVLTIVLGSIVVIWKILLLAVVLVKIFTDSLPHILSVLFFFFLSSWLLIVVWVITWSYHNIPTMIVVGVALTTTTARIFTWGTFAWASRNDFLFWNSVLISVLIGLPIIIAMMWKLVFVILKLIPAVFLVARIVVSLVSTLVSILLITLVPIFVMLSSSASAYPSCTLCCIVTILVAFLILTLLWVHPFRVSLAIVLSTTASLLRCRIAFSAWSLI